MITVGWVLTVCRSRGLPLPNHDLLRVALCEINDSTREILEAALISLERGGGSNQEMELAAIPGRCLNDRLKGEMANIGLKLEPGLLLQWCLTDENGIGKVRRAVAGSAEHIDELRLKMGQGILVDAVSTNLDVVDEPADDKDLQSPVLIAEPRFDEIARPVPSVEKRHQMGSFVNEARGSESLMLGNRKHHVYGKQGGLTFEIDIARAHEGTARQYTLRIEGAKAKGEGYLWTEKIIFQLTRRELHQAAACFLGLSEGFEFKGHGEGQEKWLKAAVQNGNLFIKVGMDRTAVAVPVGKDDLYEVGLLACRALFLNDPDLNQTIILDILRLTARVISRGS